MTDILHPEFRARPSMTKDRLVDQRVVRDVVLFYKVITDSVCKLNSIIALVEETNTGLVTSSVEPDVLNPVHINYSSPNASFTS
jgi:hypothetical protein